MTTPGVQPGGLMKLGAVAAQNIARAAGLEAHVKEIEQAIADEINAMSAHFTLAFADIQDQYEIEVHKIKGTFSFVKAHAVALAGVAVAVFVAGMVVGKLV